MNKSPNSKTAIPRGWQPFSGVRSRQDSRRMANDGFRRQTPHAFTLIELLVTIAMLAILAALLLPALNAARKKAAQSVCINNQRQLALGVTIYVNDNRDTFPGIASRAYGFQFPDWIYWRTNTSIYPGFDQSPVLASLSEPNRKTFRCPLDASDSDRLTMIYPDGDGPYLFSYSMTGYGVNNDGRNIGLTTVVDDSGGKTVVHPFKENRVRNPSAKIMLAEEPGTSSSHDSPNGVHVIQDGRWVPGEDPLTQRHGGKADVAYVDGHVFSVTPAFGADPQNTSPNL